MTASPTNHNPESGEKHTHKFDQLVTKKVLLHRYRHEEGKAKQVGTTGADVLKQRACKCGATETYDLQRVVSS